MGVSGAGEKVANMGQGARGPGGGVSHGSSEPRPVHAQHHHAVGLLITFHGSLLPRDLGLRL